MKADFYDYQLISGHHDMDSSLIYTIISQLCLAAYLYVCSKACINCMSGFLSVCLYVCSNACINCLSCCLSVQMYVCPNTNFSKGRSSNNFKTQILRDIDNWFNEVTQICLEPHYFFHFRTSQEKQSLQASKFSAKMACGWLVFQIYCTFQKRLHLLSATWLFHTVQMQCLTC